MASLAMDIGGDDDYLQLPPVEEDDASARFTHELHDALISYSLADVIPRVGGVTGASDDESELALAMAEVLKTVEAPSDDCPICLQDDGNDGTAAWKEITPCGHRFHWRCVERWLQAKGSCPMCRRQVVEMPAAAATSATSHQDLVVLLELYGEAVAIEALQWLPS